MKLIGRRFAAVRAVIPTRTSKRHLELFLDPRASAGPHSRSAPSPIARVLQFPEKTKAHLRNQVNRECWFGFPSCVKIGSITEILLIRGTAPLAYLAVA